MRCIVLLFAEAREAAGCDRLTLDNLPSSARVRDAIDALVSDYAGLAAMRNRLAFAVDERYATPDTPITDGCTLALIPPVSGG